VVPAIGAHWLSPPGIAEAAEVAVPPPAVVVGVVLAHEESSRAEGSEAQNLGEVSEGKGVSAAKGGLEAEEVKSDCRGKDVEQPADDGRSRWAGGSEGGARVGGSRTCDTETGVRDERTTRTRREEGRTHKAESQTKIRKPHHSAACSCRLPRTYSVRREGRRLPQTRKCSTKQSTE